MIIVVYGHASTGEAFQILSGQDLNFFPLPTEDQVALLVSSEVALPGWIALGAYYPVPAAPDKSSVWDWTAKAWVSSSRV